MVDAEWIMGLWMLWWSCHFSWLIGVCNPTKLDVEERVEVQSLTNFYANCAALHQFWPASSHPRAIVSKHAATQLGPQIGACPQWNLGAQGFEARWNDVEWLTLMIIEPRRKVIEPDQAFLVDGGCCEGVGCKGTIGRNQLLLHCDPMENQESRLCYRRRLHCKSQWKTWEATNWWTW